MLATTTTSEESKKATHPRPDDDDSADGDNKKGDKNEESSATMPPKKKIKLDAGESSTKSNEQKKQPAVGFLESLGQFLSGTWFWPSSMPDTKTATPAGDKTKKPLTTTPTNKSKEGKTEEPADNSSNSDNDNDNDNDDDDDDDKEELASTTSSNDRESKHIREVEPPKAVHSSNNDRKSKCIREVELPKATPIPSKKETDRRCVTCVEQGKEDEVASACPGKQKQKLCPLLLADDDD